MSILIATPDAEYYRQKLLAAFPGTVFHAATTPNEADAYISDARAIIAFASGIDAAMVDRARKLEWIQALSSGTDKMFDFCAGRSEIVISSSRGTQGPAVAEMAFVHMLTLARDLPRLIANQRMASWSRYPQPLLYGKTVVIVGTGLIAAELASRCRAFGMQTIGVSASPRILPEFDEVHARSDLVTTAARADFMVLLVPLSEDTQGLVDTRVIAAMKSTAILINLARGGVCDEQAVLEAVQQGRLGAVGLDVFETEPLPAESPLWHAEHVLVTPHMGGESDRYADLVLPILIHNVACFIKGERPRMRNVVTPTSTRKEDP